MVSEPDDDSKESIQGCDAEGPSAGSEQSFSDASKKNTRSDEADEISTEEETQEDGIERPQEDFARAEDLDPANDLGRHAAERLREFVDQRYPQGVEHSPLPEQAAQAEPSTPQGGDEPKGAELVETADAESASGPGDVGESSKTCTDHAEEDAMEESAERQQQTKDETG